MKGIVSVKPVNDFVEFAASYVLISGSRRFNLFDDVCSKEQNKATRLWSVLETPSGTLGVV